MNLNVVVIECLTAGARKATKQTLSAEQSDGCVELFGKFVHGKYGSNGLEIHIWLI